MGVIFDDDDEDFVIGGPDCSCQHEHAFEPRSGDRMQPQAAKPEASEPDLGQWEDEGGHSGLRAKIDRA